MMSSSLLIRCLTYLGTLPFIYAAVVAYLGDSGGVDLKVFVTLYGLAILSFMSGTQWGAVLLSDRPHAKNVIILSNIMTLMAFFCAWFMMAETAIIVFIVLFLAQLFVDVFLVSQGYITREYFYNRIVVVAIVVLSLAMVYACL